MVLILFDLVSCGCWVANLRIFFETLLSLSNTSVSKDSFSEENIQDSEVVLRDTTPGEREFNPPIFQSLARRGTVFDVCLSTDTFVFLQGSLVGPPSVPPSGQGEEKSQIIFGRNVGMVFPRSILLSRSSCRPQTFRFDFPTWSQMPFPFYFSDKYSDVCRWFMGRETSSVRILSIVVPFCQAQTSPLCVPFVREQVTCPMSV